MAATAYALLGRGRHAAAVTRVVLLGPAHRVRVDGLAAPDSTAFQTPLGRTAIDTEALAQLGDLPQVLRSERAHAQEHSIEVQLPFLQCVLGAFSLVPLVVGDAEPQAVAQVLERLWGGPETLIVISSDLSHFLPYAQAQAADRATVRRILDLDAGLAPQQACGAAAINGALRTARRTGWRRGCSICATPATRRAIVTGWWATRLCFRGGASGSRRHSRPGPARWWHRLDDGRIQCDLCPRDCKLHEGQRGMCFVRQRVGDAMVLTTYGR